MARNFREGIKNGIAADEDDRENSLALRYERLMHEVSIRVSIMRECIDRYGKITMALDLRNEYIDGRHIATTTGWGSGSTCAAVEIERQN
ncbi:hypothetical protein HAX54_001249, partial [Datura stramonium]|nr:hypothetical protein [Datura stramonium]